MLDHSSGGTLDTSQTDGCGQHSDRCHTNVVNTKVNGVDAYATSDLLISHPTRPGFWKVFGRVDDQIIHSTGEKVIVVCSAGTSQI